MAEQGKTRKYHFWEAFKNFALIFSFIVNLVLILVLLLAIKPVFMAKSQVAQPLLSDLDTAFKHLGETHIKSTVSVNHQLPVVFDLPLKQNTVVVLTEPVPLNAPATFALPGGGGSINGMVSLYLPVGMQLPVNLDLIVPVSTTVPVNMQIPVEIPLDQAGMGPAIEELRGVFRPLGATLESLPNSPQELLRP